jgi:salicylate hydroxylase
LDTWIFNDRVTLIGDAAHAHGGAYATGGSRAIDDAYAFSLAIASQFEAANVQSHCVERIRTALNLYKRTRKPHADRLLEIVHNANKNKAINTGRVIDEDSLKKKAAGGPDTIWLHEHDVVEAFNSSLEA